MACGYDECGMDCVPGCTGCGSSCGSGCSGGCSGCGGCGSGCSGCSGCGGSCSKNCTACTGSCSGACDNGCTATNMAAFYDALGTDIVLNAIILAADANEVVEAVKRELARRNLTGTSDTVKVGTVPVEGVRSNIRSDLVRMSYDGTGNPARAAMTASEMQGYIDYIKTLYGKILKS